MKTKTSQPTSLAVARSHLRVTLASKRRAAAARRQFLKTLAGVQVSPADEIRAMELVKFTRAAKEASFLHQYKIAA